MVHCNPLTREGEKMASRREFLRLMASAAAFAPLVRFPHRRSTGQKTLKIARWLHFMPEYNQWFDNEYAVEWGARNGVKVEIDVISTDKIHSAASAEAAAATGHDLFMFPWPPAEFCQHTIDHSEVYQAVGFKHGNVNRIGHRSTYDPNTKTYFAFCDSWMPTAVHYLEDYWNQINAPLGPLHYTGLRSGTKRIQEKLGVPSGLALSPSMEGNVTLHTLLYAFRGNVFAEDGRISLNLAPTITALKYVKALYQESGTPEQLTWGPEGNARAMQARKTSFTFSAISLVREVEQRDPPVAKNIMIGPPLLGPYGMMATPYVTSCSAIWKFAENKEGAKQFLVDMVDNFKTMYDKSQGCSFPIYQNTLANLVKRLENDPKADPPNKYLRLKDALHWTPNLGFPGFATPAAMEVFNANILPKMFGTVAKGEITPEDAVREADAEVKRIADKWNKSA
jgi:multiple sugar transport system substrate-binding protein